MAMLGCLVSSIDPGMRGGLMVHGRRSFGGIPRGRIDCGWFGAKRTERG